jgi:hypothetical protein
MAGIVWGISRGMAVSLIDGGKGVRHCSVTGAQAASLSSASLLKLLFQQSLIGNTRKRSVHPL